MATLTSSPATVSVTSFPYSLPTSPGQVVFIGTNFLHDSRPPTHSAYDWDYATMGYYGGGVFVDDYSQGGAWCVAGSGGHDVPPNVGCAIFDFQDATWKRKDNANGVPWRRNDYVHSECNQTTGELLAGSPAVVPAPGHLYATARPLSAALGGGSRGSVMHLVTLYAATGATISSYQSHTFDLNTGLWARRSTNNVLSRQEFFSSVHDPVTNRYYLFRRLQGGARLDYLDGNDWTWKQHQIGFPVLGQGFTQSCFIDQSRRLLIVLNDPNHLVALNLNNINAGWQQLSTAGGVPGGTQSQYAFYPPDGCYYLRGDGAGTEIEKLTPPPPNANPFAGTWTRSTVTLSTSLPGAHPDWQNGGSRHHNRFFYVPSIQRLAWIAGNGAQVALIKPS